MYPTGTTELSTQSNRIFFVSGSVNTAFDIAPIERKLAVVFNPSDESIYLGGNNVSPSSFVHEVPSGKLVVLEAPGDDAIYCINSSGNVAIVYASEFY